MNEWYSVLLIAVVAAVTMLLRFLPFLIFNGKRKVPRYILFLGDKLPYAIMGMLIIYCLGGTNFNAIANWLPAFISVLVVVVLHVWRRNTLLSIVSGTLLYMFFVQFVFR